MRIWFQSNSTIGLRTQKLPSGLWILIFICKTWIRIVPPSWCCWAKQRTHTKGTLPSKQTWDHLALSGLQVCDNCGEMSRSPGPLGGGVTCCYEHTWPGASRPPAREVWLTLTPQTSELFTPTCLPASLGQELYSSGPTRSPRLPWQLAQPGPLTYPVSLQVPPHLPRRWSGPQAPHHCQEVRGFDLPPLLLVI